MMIRALPEGGREQPDRTDAELFPDARRCRAPSPERLGRRIAMAVLLSALADDVLLKVPVEIARVCEARGAPWTVRIASVSGAARSPPFPTASSVDVSSILGSVPGDRQQRRRMRRLLQLIQRAERPS